MENQRDEKQILVELLEKEKERAHRVLKLIPGSLSGRFYCKGWRGIGSFYFDVPEGSVEKRHLFCQAQMHCFGTNAVAAAMSFSRLLNSDKAKSDDNLLWKLGIQESEVVVLIGEISIELTVRILPVIRACDGRFVRFGDAVEIAITKSKNDCLMLDWGQVQKSGVQANDAKSINRQANGDFGKF